MKRLFVPLSLLIILTSALLLTPGARAAGSTVSISAEAPPQMTLTHLQTAVEAGSVSVNSDLGSYTVTIRDVGQASPGYMRKGSGPGPSALQQKLRYRTHVGDYHELTGDAVALFFGSNNDWRTLYFAQSLDGDGVIEGTDYGLTIQFSVLAS